MAYRGWLTPLRLAADQVGVYEPPSAAAVAADRRGRARARAARVVAAATRAVRAAVASVQDRRVDAAYRQGSAARIAALAVEVALCDLPEEVAEEVATVVAWNSALHRLGGAVEPDALVARLHAADGGETLPAAAAGRRRLRG